MFATKPRKKYTEMDIKYVILLVTLSIYIFTLQQYVQKQGKPISHIEFQTKERLAITILQNRSKSSLQDKSNDKGHGEQQPSIILTNVRDLPSTRETSLWPDDPECSKFSTGFGSSLPLVWLPSFPRSGNTWTRYLIEAATGIYTNSVYNAEKCISLGFYGEMEKVGTGRCIVTKTHYPWGTRQDKHVPSILIIRNPAKAIVSFWNYHRSPKNIKFFYNVKNGTYESEGFRRWVKKNIKHWRQITENRLLKSMKLLVVVYEELLENPITQVHRILEFLELQEDPARMACVSKYIDGKVKGHQRKIDPYTVEEKMDLKAAIEVVTKAAQLKNITLPDYIQSLNLAGV